MAGCRTLRSQGQRKNFYGTVKLRFLKQNDHLAKYIIEYRYFTLDNSIPVGAKCVHAALRRTDQYLLL